MMPDLVQSSTLVDHGDLTLDSVREWVDRLLAAGFDGQTQVKVVRNRANPFVGALKVEVRS